MAAEILRPRFRLAHNRSGREPRLRRRLHPPRGRGRRARPARGGRGRPAGGAPARPPARRLPRQPLPRPARPLRRARADRRALARARSTALPPETVLVLNGDDPQVGSLGARRRLRPRRPAVARPALQHAADSKYCIRCGTPYDYAAAYVGHLGDYRCPNCGHARPPLEVVARAVELQGLERAAFDLVTPEGTRRVELALPGPLQRLQRARRRGARPRARRDAGRDRRRARPLQRRVRPVRADPRRRQAAAAAPDQEPGRRERGGAHARRRRRAAGRGGRAERRDRRRPRRLLDLGRRLRAAARRARDASSRRASAPPSSRCASSTAASTSRASSSSPTSSAALDRGLALTPDGGELVVLPTYTAMLAPAAARRRARPREAVLGAGRVKDPRRPPLPGLPEHLRRPRQHRRLRPPRSLARARARRDAARAWTTRSSRARTTSTTSAAARTASSSSSPRTSPRRRRR